MRQQWGQKVEIERFLQQHREALKQGTIRVLMVDECHLLWRDVTGYVWGKTKEQIEIPILNTRTRQTYYGAVDYLTGEVLVKGLPKGNSEHTVTFLNYLQQQSPNQQLVLVWEVLRTIVLKNCGHI